MSKTAKLFMHGRSQAVRLPKEFRLPGTEVRVTRMGHKIVLEPFEAPPFDVDAWWRALDALGAADFMGEEAPSDDLAQPDPAIDFG